jgi:hypothetical protein
MICSPEELRQRTRQFALRVIKLFRALAEANELVRIFAASRATAKSR